jgi:hypothetical protein
MAGGAEDVYYSDGRVLTLAVDQRYLEWRSGERTFFWQVAGNVAIGANASMQVILYETDVVFITGSSLNGSILAQTAIALRWRQAADIFRRLWHRPATRSDPGDCRSYLYSVSEISPQNNTKSYSEPIFYIFPFLLMHRTLHQHKRSTNNNHTTICFHSADTL